MATKRQKERRQVVKADAKAWADKQETTFENTVYRLPPGMKTLKLEEGINRLDVIPYIAGDNNPDADVGMQTAQRTIFVHRGLGVDGNKMRLCVAHTFEPGLPCAACKFLNNGGADEELAKKLRGQARMLMYVKNVTHKEPGEAATEILDQSYGSKDHPGFGKLLKNKLRMAPKYEDFSDLEHGFTLVCNVEPSQPPGFNKPFMKVTAIEMEERDYEYDDDERDSLPSLDSLLIVPDYDEMDKELNQEPEVEVARQGLHPVKKKRISTTPSLSPKMVSPSEEEDATAQELGLAEGDEGEYEGKEGYVIKRISPDGTSLTLKGSDGRILKGVAPGEFQRMPTPDEDEEEEEVEEEEWEEEEDEDEEYIEPDEEEEEIEEIEEEEAVAKPVKKKALKASPFPPAAPEVDDLFAAPAEEEGEGEEEEGPPPPKKAAVRKKR